MIKTDKLHFAYNGEEKQPDVLKGIDITINAGEYVAVLGHNGSGKSTLARHLNALLTPSTGTVWVNGKDTGVLQHLWEIRQAVGMVFQNPDNQIIATVVEEDVAFGPENLGVAPCEIRNCVDNTLKTVGMSDFKLSAPHNLSGGQKQRVAIAGVLSMQPSCIVLDEPTAMLDPSGRKEVLHTIAELNANGITIILITHFMEEAVLAKRVLVMHEGSIVMDDTPRGVFSKVEIMAGYSLSVPPVTALAHRLAANGLKVAKDILTVDEFVHDGTVNAIISSAQVHARSANSKTSLFKDMHTAHPCIEIKGLSHVYSEGSVFEMRALNEINLSVHKGEMIALIGHTGSGKSTLIQHLNGLLTPTAGHVAIDGEIVGADKSRLRAIRQKVGLVFQYPEHQLFESTVYKDVAYGPSRMGLQPDEIDTRVKYALSAVGLTEDIYEKSPFELSGGQKRRVAIAGVLAMRPEMLVLDEPAAGLDPKGRDEILSQVKQMHENLGITVILVSHSMDDAARLTERIVVLNRGTVYMDNTPANVFMYADKLIAIGLDIPQISQLAAKLARASRAIPASIFTINEMEKALLTAAEKSGVPNYSADEGGMKSVKHPRSGFSCQPNYSADEGGMN